MSEIWEFKGDHPTFLYTESIEPGKVYWKLELGTNDRPGERAYEIKEDPSDILDNLQHICEKTWLYDKGQLLEALLPAIRAVVFK